MEKEDIERRGHGKGNEYTEEELLEWIDAWVEMFGVVPVHDDFDAKGPFPGAETYRRRFGSFTDAVREAGYEPRGET